MIVKRIRELLKEKHIFAKDMLKDLGINKDQLKRWEMPGATIKPIYVNAIAEYLQVSPEYLLGKTDKKEKPEGKPSPSELLGDDDKIISLCRSLPLEKRQQALEYLEYLASHSKGKK